MASMETSSSFFLFVTVTVFPREKMLEPSITTYRELRNTQTPTLAAQSIFQIKERSLENALEVINSMNQKKVLTVKPVTLI
jgi:hypothetical protein